MDELRRKLLVGLGAGLAGCAPRRPIATRPLTLDTGRLEREFPALAARARPALLNIGVLVLANTRSWYSDYQTRMPMQSVFKAPLAAAALAEVDAGRLRLGERIHLDATDLSPPPSSIDQAWPTPPDGHTLDTPAVDLIALAVQRSDNTAADAIMKRIGGPGAVTAWLRSKQIGDMSVDRYERDLQPEVAGMPPFRPEWKDEDAWLAARDAVPPAVREAAMNAYLADPRDTTTTPAAIEFLRQLADGELLSPASTRLLLRLMSQTTGGAHRLRAGLPDDASLAHKTGTAGTDLGLTPAVNDIGIVTLGDGRRFAIVAFLAGSTATERDRDGLIADAARLVMRALA
jgi:beta-lactamase class A